MASLVEKAFLLAESAHKTQVRKESATPYIVHPVMVAFLLTQHGFDEVTVAASLVHDVLEDTAVTEEELTKALGSEVVTLVLPVTHDDRLSWEEKKKAYIESVRHAPEAVKAIATADKIHNAQSLLAAYAIQGPGLWSHFNAGKEKKLWFEESMLSMLKETWGHPLVEEYEQCVRQMRALV